jgi:O-antigen ligase
MLYNILTIFFFLLPFQFALNPAAGIDLAFARIFIVIFFLVWIMVSFKNRLLKIPFGLSALCLYSFIFICFFSLFFAQNSNWFFRKFIFLMSIFPIFLFAQVILSTKERTKRAVSFLVSGAALLSLVGIIQFISQFIFGIDALSSFWSKTISPFFLGNTFSTQVNQYPSWLVNIGGKTYMRAIGFFPDPHMLAFFLGLIFPWSVALSIQKNKGRWIYIIFSFLIITCDILTFSRGGYLGLFFGLIFLFFLIFKKNIKIFAILLLLTTTFLFFTKNPATTRLFSTFNLEEGSNNSRILIWKEGLSVLKKNPLGVGLGNYPLEVKPSANYREPIYAHMLYLDIAVEVGILGLLFWIAFIVFLIFDFYDKAKKDPFYLAGIFSIIIFSAHALVENPLFSIHVLTLFLILSSIGAKKKYA